MRMKIHTAIGMFAWSMAIMAAALPVDSIASNVRAETIETQVSGQPALRTAASYSVPVYSTYARPAVSDRDTLSVSVVPEVDSWTMLAAILGLISMRLWRSSKKNLLVVE